MSFYKKKEETFRNTKLDVFVFFVVLSVFIWAFFIDSWQPLKDEDGNITYYTDPSGMKRTISTLNMQVFIAPIIMVYEFIVLIVFPGKKRGRYLPWCLWYCKLKYMAMIKWEEGMKDTKEWRKHK